MRILAVVDTNYHHDERVKNETIILARAGFDITVLFFDFGSKSSYPSYHAKITALPVRKSKKWKNRLFFFSNLTSTYFRFWAKIIDQQLKDMHYDAIHLHDLYMFKAALLLRNKMNIPIILDLHENYPEAVLGYRWATKFPNRFITMPHKWRSFAKKHLHKPERLIVLSRSFKEQLTINHPHINPDKIYIYPNVPDIERILSFQINNLRLNKTEDDIFLLYFGGISQRRGIYTAIESLAYLKGHSYNIKLILIGPIDNNEKNDFSKFIEQSSDKHRLVYLPWINFEELPSYIHISDICLSPIAKNAQHESGVANKVFQYMLFQKPVVVSNCKPQAQIVEEEKCGLIFKSGDAADLAHKIGMLMCDKKQREKMGFNGKRAVLMKYNTEKMGQRLIDLYLSLKKE